MGQGNKTRRKGGSGSYGHTGTKNNRGPKHGHGNKGKGGGSSALSGNPTGMTFDQAMKIYGVDNKTDLQARMRYNPAETTGFYNLIDDSKKTNTNKGSDMATYKKNNKLTVSGPQLSTGSSTPTKYNPGSFGDGGYRLTGNFPSTAQTINVSGNQSANTGSANTGKMPADNNVKDYLGGLYQGAFNRDPEFNNDPSNTADYWVDAVSKGQQGDRDWKEWLAASIYGSDEKKGMASTGSDASSPSQTQQQTQQQPVQQAVQQAASSGLTLDDLNSWWDGKQNNQPNQFDQFKEFMGMLGDMPGMGGGYGYGYPNMGYGGGAPGGVAAANPYGNMMSFMNAFKNMGSGGSDSKLASSSLTK